MNDDAPRNQPRPANSGTNQPKRARRPLRRALIVTSASIGLVLAGWLYIAWPRSSESTDDAYLKADSTIVATRVRGHVAAILAVDNQLVRTGDPLVRIHGEEFEARVAAARADLRAAKAAVDGASAALAALEAEERLAEANVRAAEAAIRAADAQSARAATDHGRYDRLIAAGHVTQRDADRARAAALSAQADADRARAVLDVNRNQLAVVRAKRAGLLAAVGQAEASVARAEAALDLAQIDRDHTVVRAPVDGFVANRQAQRGAYVEPGTRLLTLVPLQALYVTANFKETQSHRIRPGQPALVEIDALPGSAFKGEVDSLAPGTGSEFSLFPYEPGTGNFTKIVQRVPVRIRLHPNQDNLERLRPGLSATVVVRLGGRR